jgi:hypothetical protein
MMLLVAQMNVIVIDVINTVVVHRHVLSGFFVTVKIVTFLRMGGSYVLVKRQG